jgi:tetratricopeptide (TPR) repeat protein
VGHPGGYQQAAVLSAVPIRTEHPFGPEAGSGLSPVPGQGRRPQWSRGAVKSVTFSPDGGQLLAVLLNSDLRVYDMEPILAKLNQPAQDFRAETERQTGLRLQGGLPVPVPRAHPAGDGEPPRQIYRQDPVAFFGRKARIDATCSEKGRYKEAKKEFLSLLAEPGVPESVGWLVRCSLARTHTALGAFDQARALVREVRETHLDDPLAHQTLVKLHIQQRQYAEARDLLRQVLEMPGLLPHAELYAHRTLAEVYALTGDLSQAEAEAEKAAAVREADLHPAFRATQYPRPRLTLGRVYFQQRQFARARAQAERVLAMNPAPPLRHEARLLLADVCVEEGEIDRAAAEVARVLDADKDNPAARHARASLAALRGKDLEQAEADMKDLAEGEPTNLWYPVTLARVRARRGQAGQALPALERLSQDEVLGPARRERLARGGLFAEFLWADRISPSSCGRMGFRRRGWTTSRKISSASGWPAAATTAGRWCATTRW